MSKPTPSATQRRLRLGALLIAIGVIGLCACVVWFAAGGYVAARYEVFGGWIVATFLGAVAFAALASYGMILRRRVRRDERRRG